jgi:cation:H+ antiporter
MGRQKRVENPAPLFEFAMPLLLTLLGCTLLYFGGDMLVSASTFIADRVGMSPMAIGATVVAIGTSAPELAVSLDAAVDNHYGVSVGNVVGSNVCNIILVLGLCGLIRPLRPSSDAYRVDFPILIFVSAAFTLIVYDQMITRLEGLALTLGLLTYLVWNLRRAAVDDQVSDFLREEVEGAMGDGQSGWGGTLLRALGGVACLAIGAKWLVDGSLQVLAPFALSEAAIGVTVVALGTSVPEIGTSMIAAKKGHADLGVGNAIGSSVFNILGVLGITAVIRPLEAADVGIVDGVLLVATSCAGLVLVARQGGIGRPQGALLVVTYALYVISAFV